MRIAMTELKHSRILLSLLAGSLLLGFSPVVHAADISWRLYLKPTLNQGPVLSKTLTEGQDFIIEDVILSGANISSREIMDDLDGVSFSLAQNPVAQTLELRLILNVGGSQFDKAGAAATFFNLTVDAYVGGRLQNAFRFSPGSPLTVTIPQGSGLDNLLGAGGMSRSDFLLFAYFEGSKFNRSGIDTYNQLGGLKASADHAATIVGGLGESFGFSPEFQLSPWHKIKELFK